MRTKAWSSWIVWLLIPALILACPGWAAAGWNWGISSDSSSKGAEFTLVLLGAACVVFLLLGIKADYENIFTKAPEPERVDQEQRVAFTDMRGVRENLFGGASGADNEDARFELAWSCRF